LRTLPNCELSAVVDSDPEKGGVLARHLDVPYVANIAEVLSLSDAAVLATPSDTHADLGVALLDAGLDLLVEKPIAPSVNDAERLIAAAVQSGRILMVGHIERFNPAVLELKRLIDQPIHLDLTRTGPFSPRVTADVVLDLMIHDLDLALSFIKSNVDRVSAVGSSVRTDSLDLASALISWENGVTATLTASRVGQTKVRQIQVTQRDTFVAVDLLRQDVTIHRVDHNEFLSDGGSRYRQTGLIEIPYLEHRGEPLSLELEHFIDCVTARTQPEVGGEEGMRALKLALDVKHLAESANTRV
jgi:predicted dehydrogenase